MYYDIVVIIIIVLGRPHAAAHRPARASAPDGGHGGTGACTGARRDGL